MVCHEGQTNGAGKSNSGREGSSEEIDHGDGEGSKDQRDDSEVPLGFCKRIKEMGQEIEERGLKVSGIFFIVDKLFFEVISGLIKSIDLIDP